MSAYERRRLAAIGHRYSHFISVVLAALGLRGAMFAVEVGADAHAAAHPIADSGAVRRVMIGAAAGTPGIAVGELVLSASRLQIPVRRQPRSNGEVRSREQVVRLRHLERIVKVTLNDDVEARPADRGV